MNTMVRDALFIKLELVEAIDDVEALLELSCGLKQTRERPDGNERPRPATDVNAASTRISPGIV